MELILLKIESMKHKYKVSCVYTHIKKKKSACFNTIERTRWSPSVKTCKFSNNVTVVTDGIIHIRTPINSIEYFYFSYQSYEQTSKTSPNMEN